MARAFMASYGRSGHAGGVAGGAGRTAAHVALRFRDRARPR